MDQREDRIHKRFNKKQFLKRTLQFVFSVSVFSIFVWYSSGFSIHPQSFNAYFSTCLFSMITHTLERKYMFLICNAILALIAKTSLMSPSPPTTDSEFEFQASNDLSETKVLVSEIAVVPLRSFESSDNAPFMLEEQVKLQEEYHEEVAEADQEQEECTLHAKNEACIAEEEEEEVKEIDEEEGGGEGTESGDEVVEQDNEPAETTMTSATKEELTNTDELNRKIEEFIRKMKEEMRIEAQRPLIAV